MKDSSRKNTGQQVQMGEVGASTGKILKMKETEWKTRKNKK